MPNGFFGKDFPTTNGERAAEGAFICLSVGLPKSRATNYRTNKNNTNIQLIIHDVLSWDNAFCQIIGVCVLEVTTKHGTKSAIQNLKAISRLLSPEIVNGVPVSAQFPN